MHAMFANTIESDSTGLWSRIARAFLACLAVLAGAAIVSFAINFSLQARTLLLGLPLFIVMPFWWAAYGCWFPIGMLAFGAMSSLFWMLVLDRAPKHAFFALLSASTVYFAPICFHDRHWLPGLAIYSGCALLYWLLTRALLRFRRTD